MASAPTRVLILGTAESCASAIEVLRAQDPLGRLCEVVGIAVADRIGGGDSGGGIDLPQTSLSGLEAFRREHPFDVGLICLPSAMSRVAGRARAALKAIGVPVRTLPLLGDVLGGEDGGGRGVSLDQIDLLGLVGRASRPIDRELAVEAVGGKRVMITGAGGSIGSEIARICARFSPSELILMDRSDNALFEIDRQLARIAPGVRRKVVLHDVVDSDSTLRRMVELRPEVIFHAAAHKHVPLMEDHPAAAVNNNLFGTKSVADAALNIGAERFVMISTDKAVNPTSVMGATKRLAELYVRSLNSERRTRFSLVRFGNVLGSACSVLPIWASQVSEGGPLTVTHPEMTRYFMTIPEAAALVIQASTIGGDAPFADRREVFVLDMGEPVSILGLACRFVESLGLEPVIEGDGESRGIAARPGRVPVRIVFSGVRPGEKLYEELSYSAEELEPTLVPGVMAWSGERPERAEIARMVADLSGVRGTDDRETVLRAISRHVPGFAQVRAGEAVREAEQPEIGVHPPNKGSVQHAA